MDFYPGTPSSIFTSHQGLEGDANASSSNSGSGSGVTFGNANSNAMIDYQKAHGIIMGVVMVLLFPFAAMFVRMGGSGIVHGILQVLSLCALIVGLGLGIKLADLTQNVSSPFAKRQWSPPPGFDPTSFPGFGDDGGSGDNGNGGSSGSGATSSGGGSSGSGSTTFGGAAGASAGEGGSRSEVVLSA